MTTAPSTTVAATAAASRRRARRVVGLLVSAVVGCSLVAVAAPAAQATSYRYWTYWSGDGGSWAFSSIGAARRPPNGGVEGWRFEVSQAASSSQPPRTAASFTAVCGTGDPAPGKKRVALVIDYGSAADAPPGEHPPAGIVTACVEIDAAATGYDVLASKASIRAQSGLICGIGGYPATGCGEAASDPAPAATPTHSPTAGTGGGPTSTGGSSGTSASGSSKNADSTTPPSKKHPTKSQRSAGAASQNRPDSATATEASDSTTPAAASSPADDSTGGSPIGALVGVAVIALIGAAAWFIARTRRAS